MIDQQASATGAISPMVVYHTRTHARCPRTSC